MLLSILTGIVLAVVTFIIARQFWTTFKRDSYLVGAIRNPAHLESFVTREALDNPSPMMTTFSAPNELGYATNIHIANISDRAATRRIKLVLAILLASITIASYFFGTIYIVINVAVLLLAALAPVPQPAKASALHHVLALAHILRCWHMENPTECANWIEQAWTLRPLYNVVKKVC